jgi:cobalt-zinc-cadmium efflux system protein
VSDEHDHSGTGTTRLAVALGITAVVMGAEVVGSILTGSLALLTDAAHMLTDAGGLLIALIATFLVSRPPSARRTWGFKRAEVIAASVQSILLVGVGVFVAIEAVRRLFETHEILSGELVVFGIVGLVGNIACVFVLFGARGKNMNLRAAFLDVLSDTLGSVAVIVAAVIMLLTAAAGHPFYQADAIAALVVAALIVPRAIKLLKDTWSVLLESTPKGIELDELREHFLELPHVQDVHDLHVTQIATGIPVLTAHVVVDESCFKDGHAPEMLDELQKCVAEHFDVAIEHSTFQLEPASHAPHEHETHA